MMPWPADYQRRWTLANGIACSGVGLHSGASATVRLVPREAGGLWIGKGTGNASRALHSNLVRPSRLCTLVQLASGTIATVEHLLAAIGGCGITDLEILVDGEEIPLLDGSALPWVELFSSAGLEDLGPRQPLPALGETICIQQGDAFIRATPCEQLRLSAAVNYASKAIGPLLYELDLNPASFVAELSSARTFGFADQIGQLQAAGLIRGGSLDNALVCDQQRWLNPPLRFSDEPVRHKLLDLVGDLALASFPRAHVFAYRGSHALHIQLAQALDHALGEPV
ncbi:MAG: UDP-3-O-acyl-N-acetylglucosamine deacetylase [Aphanocapsa feldmannii 288cV]|nr:MAG: UDP-3-O-acyl-N-acetylglucosamine deacetylase [Aphanocapsa feldmannii 288cV]